MKKLLWIFFIGICFAQSGQNFLKKTEVGDSINAHLTNYADKPEMMDSILANAGTVSGLPDTALVLRQVIIDSSSAIRADMGNASINYIDSVANLKLDKSALKDSINARNLVYEPELDDSISSVRQVIIDSTASVTQNLADSMNTIMMLSEVIDSINKYDFSYLKTGIITDSTVVTNRPSLTMTSAKFDLGFPTSLFTITREGSEYLYLRKTGGSKARSFYIRGNGGGAGFVTIGDSSGVAATTVNIGGGLNSSYFGIIGNTKIAQFVNIDTVKNSGVFRNTGFVNSVAGYLFNGTDINTKNTLTNVAYKDSTNTFTQTQKATVFNATSGLQLNGTSINTAGTLSNVAYRVQNNNFPVAQTINNQATAATKIGLVNGAFGASSTGLYLHNVSSTSIIPAVTGYGSTTGLFMLAYTKDSTAAQNAFHFSARKIGGTVLTTGRPLVFTNYTTELFSINYDGKVKIGAGTGTEALDVTGNIKASGTVTGTNLTYKTQKRLLFQTALDSALISTTDTIPLGYTPISGTIDTVIIISYGATAPDYTLNLYHSGSTSAFSTAQAINAKGLVKKTTFADATFIAGKLYVVFPAVTTIPTRTKLAIYVIGTYD